MVIKNFLGLKSYVFEKSVSVCQFKSKISQTNKLDTVTGIIKSKINPAELTHHTKLPQPEKQDDKTSTTTPGQKVGKREGDENRRAEVLNSVETYSHVRLAGLGFRASQQQHHHYYQHNHYSSLNRHSLNFI